MKLEREQYQSRCIEGEVWIPSSQKTTEGFYQPGYPSSSGYKDSWKDWVISQYLPRVKVWRCSLEEDSVARVLESQIQIKLAERFNIKYYKKDRRWLWLGKVEEPDEAVRSGFQFRFSNFPDVESETREVLAALSV